MNTLIRPFSRLWLAFTLAGARLAILKPMPRFPQAAGLKDRPDWGFLAAVVLYGVLMEFIEQGVQFGLGAATARAVSYVIFSLGFLFAGWRLFLSYILLSGFSNTASTAVLLVGLEVYLNPVIVGMNLLAVAVLMMRNEKNTQARK